MQKKILLLFFILIITTTLFSQYATNNYLLEAENKILKTSSETPASNSVSDIIIQGDTIWFGTSRGLTRTTDNGQSFTNYYNTPAFGTESISGVGFYEGKIWAATAHSVQRDGASLPEGSGLRFSTDGGTTWNAVPQPLDAPDDSTIVYGINDGINLPKVRAIPITVSIQNITYDIAFTPGTIWVATFAGGLRKSTDNGQTWQRVLLPSDFVTSISPNDTIRFPLLPVSGTFGTGSLNHRVFSVTAIDDSTLFVGTAGGINKSTDGGISWRKFNHLNQEFSISGNFVVALEYNKFDNTLWASTWRAEGSTEFYGVSFTTDKGETWQTSLNGERIHNFGFKFNQVIAVGDNGAFRSSNNGGSWILPNSIIDSQTRLSLNTNTFFGANVKGDDVWLGSSEGLARITETTGMWNGTWKLFISSQPLESKEDTYAFPNPFSPKIDQLKLKYSTGGKEASVTIRIFDFGMNLVKTVIQNARRGFPVHQVDGFTSSSGGVVDFWDGKDEAGSVVPNGVYFYRIDVDSEKPVYGKIMVLQ